MDEDLLHIRKSGNNRDVDHENAIHTGQEQQAPPFHLSAAAGLNTTQQKAHPPGAGVAGESRMTQMHLTGTASPPPFQLKSTTSSGMDGTTLSNMSQSFGTDFSDVKVHRDSQSAVDAGALAYTQGNDIHFAPGRYDPFSQSGRELLGHELTHVVQQREGRVQANNQVNGMPLNDDKGLEKEADEMGANAAQLKTANTNHIPGILNSFHNPIQKHGDHNGPDPLEQQRIAVNQSTGGSGGSSAAPGPGPAPVPGITPAPASGAATPLSPDEQLLKDNFLGTPRFGPQDLAHAISPGSGVGIGGFEATYFTAAQLLLISLRGKIQFQDAVTNGSGGITPNHPQLNNLVTYLNSLPARIRSQVMPFFSWTADQKTEHMIKFRQRLLEAFSIWQGAGHHFELGDLGWTDIKAYPIFNILGITEGAIGGNDHLQINVFKSLAPQEVALVNAILRRRGRANIQPGLGEVRAYAGANLGSNGSVTDENPLSNEMILSSNDLDSSNHDTTRGGNNFLRESIMFRRGATSLTRAQKRSIQAFIDGHKTGDTISENSNITLIGYGSSSGSEEQNRTIVDARLNAVRDEILTNPSVTAARIGVENRSNVEASSLSQDKDTQANEQRVEIRIGSGERQNTLAHELGHVFGLSDEYEEDTRTAGQPAWHDQTAIDAGVGGANIEQNDNIISVGNTVRPQHYSTFAWALNQLTGSATGNKKWLVM